MARKIEKSEAQWKSELSEEDFAICRGKGTERAFTGKYNDSKEAGVFLCKCCGEELFSSETKYDSGSGWPSFWQPLNKESIDEETDMSMGVKRVEVMCDACGSHLGHVFEDGPKPTGLRYCINSASLSLKKDGT